MTFIDFGASTTTDMELGFRVRVPGSGHRTGLEYHKAPKIPKRFEGAYSKALPVSRGFLEQGLHHVREQADPCLKPIILGQDGIQVLNGEAVRVG